LLGNFNKENLYTLGYTQLVGSDGLLLTAHGSLTLKGGGDAVNNAGDDRVALNGIRGTTKPACVPCLPSWHGPITRARGAAAPAY